MSNLTFFRGTNTFDQFRREMDRLFTTFFTGSNYTNYNTTSHTGYTTSDNTTWTPSCEFVETDKTFVIKAEVPGITDKDIDIQVATNQLTIKGERKTDWEETKGTTHFTERTYGTFFRSFTLPTTVDTTKIRARYNNGVLEVEMPKTTATTLTKVKVEQK